MKRFAPVLLTAVTLFSLAVSAGPRGAGGRLGDNEESSEDRGRKAHMMAVVGIAEALGLNETDALKMSEKLKTFETKRRPLREGMREAMKGLHAATEGDATALAQVDANVQKVLDGRAQLATIDKEMFTTLAQGQSPEKRAKLALFMARFGSEMHKLRGAKGRR